MAEIKFDSRNYRIHNERNKSLIRKSLEECGAGRSIVIDSDDEIIAGNGIYEEAQKLGMKTKIIETDGTELVVVKRTDLKRKDKKRQRLAVLDNTTSDSSEQNISLMKEDFEIPEMEELGIEIEDIEIEERTEKQERESKYTRKINVPIYEVKGDLPEISEMLDTTKADLLIKKIDASDLPDTQKEFLRKTATRFFEFKYDKIAEYYAHQDTECQELMESLALVIIDFDKAVEQGYVKLNKFIEDVFLKENDIER